MNVFYFTHAYVGSMKSPVVLDSCERDYRKLVSADPGDIRTEIWILAIMPEMQRSDVTDRNHRSCQNSLFVVLLFW